MKSIFTVLLVSVMLSGFIATKTAQAQSTSCYLFDKNSGTPMSGFAAAYYPLSSSKELIIDVTCDRDDREAEVTIGDGNPLRYIYEVGYLAEEVSTDVWTDWEDNQITYGGTPVLDGNGNETGWLKADANLKISHISDSLDREQALLAYTCTWEGVPPQGSWKCGCVDSACTTNTWQLQKYQFPADTSGGSTSGSTSGGGPKTVVVDVRSSNFAFDVTEIRVDQGDTVQINLTNDGGTHDWVVDEFNAFTKVLNLSGEVDTIQFVADQKGTFEYYCSIGNHRALGMVGNVIVE